MDGKEFSSLINADIVKKYYAWGNQEKWLAKVENPKEIEVYVDDMIAKS